MGRCGAFASQEWRRLQCEGVRASREATKSMVPMLLMVLMQKTGTAEVPARVLSKSLLRKAWVIDKKIV